MKKIHRMRNPKKWLVPHLSPTSALAQLAKLRTEMILPKSVKVCGRPKENRPLFGAKSQLSKKKSTKRVPCNPHDKSQEAMESQSEKNVSKSTSEVSYPNLSKGTVSPPKRQRKTQKRTLSSKRQKTSTVATGGLCGNDPQAQGLTKSDLTEQPVISVPELISAQVNDYFNAHLSNGNLRVGHRNFVQTTHGRTLQSG